MTDIDRSAGVRTVYATDNSIYQVPPSGVVVASSAADVQALLTANNVASRPLSITARGAGTGTNGQSLTSGLILDMKRQMNGLHELDLEAMTVTVGPGMVTAELNEQLSEHGVFWPPSTSTVTRATVGGMISTDAAGQGSLLYGRTSRHVTALDVVLDDGTPWHAAAVPEAEARALASGREAGSSERIAKIWQALLDVPDRHFDLPELARGFSGYGIDRVRSSGLIDPIPVLCGSEGTLAVITSATLTLTRKPAENVLIIAAYPSFDAALVDSLRLASSQPTAIETLDERTVEKGRASTAWPLLQPVVGDASGALLLLEYTGDEPPDVAAVQAAIEAGGQADTVQIVTDANVKAAVWKVRADAVGLLAKVAPGAARPTAFVEDCAVPVAHMPAFIDGFRRILDRRGLTYGMFGHADVGCVHVRPALDPVAEDHEATVAAITGEVVALLAEHGGILWGEHGRGVRGQFVEDFLPADVIQVMRQLKSAFDPNDRFNPGKLYRPLSVDEPLLQIDEVPTRAATDRRIPLEVRSEFATAFSCNGNGLCHHYSASEVMCPSFKATGDPVQAPKGRADLIRAWLAAEEQGGASTALTTDVADSLHRCLSCAACTGRCPVQVDIPELKSRFFERYYQRHRRPLAHRLLSRFEEMAALAAIVPPAARLGARALERRLGLVDLPTPSRRRRLPCPTFDTVSPTDLVLVLDVFTATFEPGTLAAAVHALRSVGYSVSASPFVPSGKFDHVKGDRTRFGEAARKQAALIRSIADAGSVPVVIDPAIALLYDHEYPAVLPGFPTNVVKNVVEVLHARIDQLSPASVAEQVSLFGHCTERSLAPSWVDKWKAVLEAGGHTVDVIETTCCGMAGIFGHEVGNQEVSRHLFNRGWRHQLTESDRPVATGWSCRSQTKRLGGPELRHPLTLLT